MSSVFPLPSGRRISIVQRIYPVTIDYSLPLDAALAAGQYDDVDPSITSGEVSIFGEGIFQVEIELVRYDECYDPQNLVRDGALGDLAYAGLTPLKLEHALALGAQYPQRPKGRVVFLGQRHVLRGISLVPILDKDDRGKRLSLHWDGGLTWTGVSQWPVEFAITRRRSQSLVCVSTW